MTEYLSDQEKEKLENFNEDPVLKEAVRKVLLSYIYQQGTLKKGEQAFNPLQNWALHPVSKARETKNVDYDSMGRELAVMGEGVMLVQTAFDEINRFRKETKMSKKKDNPAI